MRIQLKLKENSYDVILEKGCLARAGELLKLDRALLAYDDPDQEYTTDESELKNAA